VLIAESWRLIHRGDVPEIRKVHQFEITRMKRDLVGCYTADATAVTSSLTATTTRSRRTDGSPQVRRLGLAEVDIRLKSAKNHLPSSALPSDRLSGDLILLHARHSYCENP